MTTTREISNADDVIDSRDVIERIEELKTAACVHCGNVITWRRRETTDADAWGEESWDDDRDFQCGMNAEWVHESEDDEELAALYALAKHGLDYSPDWEYGATLIRDSYFEDYARELAEDIGAIEGDESWPLTYIDWEAAAEALKQDYTSVEFDGITYWVR